MIYLKKTLKSYSKQINVRIIPNILEAGADVRYVSELLGHNCIETTVKYTHPSQDSQRKAYRMYHPRENSYFKELSTLRRRIKSR